MKWSWKLGSFSGIDVFIHATFLLIIGWVGFSSWQQSGTLTGTLEGILFVLILFGCVLLHEFGHSLSARRYGIQTRDITLYPIGGVARLERMPDRPIQEFWVALAGPAVNFGIAALLFAGVTLLDLLAPLMAFGPALGSFLQRLVALNILLALFNLIPAFPMDGGRILRAVMAMRLEYTRATQIAASIGRASALLFGILGLLGNPLLVFIAAFIWLAAGQEASQVRMKARLNGIPVGRVTITHFESLSPNDTLDRAVELILAGSQTDFPVVENNIPVGVVTRKDVFDALSTQERSTLITRVMRRDFDVAEADEMLEPVFLRMQMRGNRVMPVTYDGKLIGLLTVDNISEFLMLESVLRQARRREAIFQPGGFVPGAG